MLDFFINYQTGLVLLVEMEEAQMSESQFYDSRPEVVALVSEYPTPEEYAAWYVWKYGQPRRRTPGFVESFCLGAITACIVMEVVVLAWRGLA